MKVENGRTGPFAPHRQPLLLLPVRFAAFLVEARLHFPIRFGQYQVVSEAVGFPFFERPRNLFHQHLVHWRHHLGGDIDQPLRQHQSNLRRTRRRKQAQERRELRIRTGPLDQVLDQSLDPRVLLHRFLPLSLSED